MPIVRSIVPRRRNARRAGLPVALIALQACLGSVPDARAQTSTRADAVRPGAADPAEPRVRARDVVGEQGATIPLLVEVRHRAGLPGGSTYILGLPKGARLSDADHAVTATEDGAMIEVTDWTVADLAVTLPPEQTGAFTLAVAALSLTEIGRALPIARSVFTLRVQPRQAGPAPSPAIRPAAAPAVPRAEASPQAPPPAPRNPALLARAERLVRSGDISGARLVLEHLVERGDARATVLLAQTYDPGMLRAWRVHGLRPDPERASALYARAAEAGQRDPRSVAEAAR